MKKKYYLEIFVLALSVFVASVIEVLPSGVLPIIAKDFNIPIESAGSFTGIYAIGAAIAAIPLASLTMQVNRKKLFIYIMAGFAISGFGFVFAKDFKVALFFRLVGGIACGVFFPMIAAFAIKISPLNMRSRVIPMVMFGGTVGISLGIPFFTRLGIERGWKFEFLIFAIFTSIVVFLGIFFLSDTPGEKRSRDTAILVLAKNKHVIVVTLATIFGVFAHYGSYVYHTLILENQLYPAEVDFALAIYGIGSMVSIISATILLHKFLRNFNLAIMIAGAFSMLLMRFFPGKFLILNIALILWGFTNGSISPALQTAISKNINEGLSNAIALQSCAFNLAIMLASSAFGLILKNFGVNAILILSALSFSAAVIIILYANKTFRN